MSNIKLKLTITTAHAHGRETQMTIQKTKKKSKHSIKSSLASSSSPFADEGKTEKTEKSVLKQGKMKVTSGIASAIKSKKAPGKIISKQPTEEEVRAWLATPHGFIEGLTETDGGITKLYDYQIRFMQVPMVGWRFRCVNKSRQTGFSYVIASEGLSKCMLSDKYTKIFISYNEEESKEKILYAKTLYHSLPLGWQNFRKLKIDNMGSLEFETSLGRRTRLISFPQRPPRGKGYNTDVDLDEAAHYKYASQIYTAALPIITRGGGVVSVVSTPLGEGDVFSEIDKNLEGKYKFFFRQQIFWWDCPDFCKNVDKARIEAPYMDTRDRVYKFGKDILIQLYESFIDEVDFKQEYECYYIDESVSYFPYSLIKQCQFDEDELQVAHSIEELSAMVQAGIITGMLFGGYDVGRTHDKSELYVFEKTETRIITRAIITFANVKFQDQELALRQLMTQTPIMMLIIDKNGIGAHLAENMEFDFIGRVRGTSLMNEEKGFYISGAKVAMQNGSLMLPMDKNLARQFHSIKRKTSDSGNTIFSAERSGRNKDHADKVMALVLGLSGLEAAFPEFQMPQQTEKSRELARKIKTPVSRVFKVARVTEYGKGSYLDAFRS